jgi:hypothetical protein
VRDRMGKSARIRASSSSVKTVIGQACTLR